MGQLVDMASFRKRYGGINLPYVLSAVRIKEFYIYPWEKHKFLQAFPNGFIGETNVRIQFQHNAGAVSAAEEIQFLLSGKRENLAVLAQGILLIGV